MKDVSVSFGIKAIDPCDHDNGGFSTTSATRGLSTENSIFGHFNMSNPDRLSSLVSINSPFFKLTHNLTVEVDYQGNINIFKILFIYLFIYLFIFIIYVLLNRNFFEWCNVY